MINRIALIILASLSFGLMLASAPPTTKKLSSFDPQVKALLAKMTLEEKIGQMTQPDQSFIKDLSDVETYAFGSVFSGGDSDPKEGNSVVNWTDMYERIQKHTHN